MSTIQEIESAVAQLPPQQLADFQAWLTEFVATEMERANWHQLSAQGLARAYGNDEPNYSADDLKTVNLGYAGR